MTLYALTVVGSDPPLLCSEYGDTLSIETILTQRETEGPFVWTNKKRARQARTRFFAWTKNDGVCVAMVELETHAVLHEVR